MAAARSGDHVVGSPDPGTAAPFRPHPERGRWAVLVLDASGLVLSDRCVILGVMDETPDPMRTAWSMLAACPPLLWAFDSAWSEAEATSPGPDLEWDFDAVASPAWSPDQQALWQIATDVARWQWWQLDPRQADAVVLALVPVLKHLAGVAAVDPWPRPAHVSMAAAANTAEAEAAWRSLHPQ